MYCAEVLLTQASTDEERKARQAAFAAQREAQQEKMVGARVQPRARSLSCLAQREERKKADALAQERLAAARAAAAARQGGLLEVDAKTELERQEHRADRERHAAELAKARADQFAHAHDGFDGVRGCLGVKTVITFGAEQCGRALCAL